MLVSAWGIARFLFSFSSVLGENLLAKFEAHRHSTAELLRYWADILQRSFSGNGLCQGADSTASSSWIADPPTFWSGADFIKAIQLRGNILPTKSAPYNSLILHICKSMAGATLQLHRSSDQCRIYSIKQSAMYGKQFGSLLLSLL